MAGFLIGKPSAKPLTNVNFGYKNTEWLEKISKQAKKMHSGKIKLLTPETF